MLTLVFGKIGSGKSATVVRDIVTNVNGFKTYSNINIKGCNNVIPLSTEMIVKTRYDVKKGIEVPDSVNVDFWKNQTNEPCNVVLDEVHTLLNSRRRDKLNVIMNDWVALLRRVIGSADSGYGEMVMITQLSRRIDVIERELANRIRYCTCHYTKTCTKCGHTWSETSEFPKPIWRCAACGAGSKLIRKYNHIIEVFEFANIHSFNAWEAFGMKSYFDHYYINDIEDYFRYYDTLQWDNLISRFVDKST